MESKTPEEIIHEFPPFFRVHKDGRIERFMTPHPVPVTADPKTGVQSKDVVISSDPKISARLFLPKIHGPDSKLPLLVHYHGGGFCGGSALDGVTLNFLNSLAAEANAIALSVEYRLAPEHPLPIAYDDCWAALQWVASHANGHGPEPLINRYADLGRVFLAGESAGANLAHHVAVRAGATPLEGLKIKGVMIVHPFFGSKEEDKMYRFMCPSSSGREDDPRLNPAVDPNLSDMGCERVLVCLAEKDGLKERGKAYYETLKGSRWSGSVEILESPGEDHCFHMFNPNSDQAPILLKRFASFMNQD